jgi:hypothetical protein
VSAGVEGGVLGAPEPAVGGHVARPVEPRRGGQDDRRDQIVDVHELRGRVAVDVGHPAGGVEGPGQPAVGAVVAHDRGRPQHGGAGRRVVVAPLGQPALDLGPLHGVGQIGTGSQGGVLGERHGVVGPGAVDRGRRQQDDVVDADVARRVEEPLGGDDVLGRLDGGILLEVGTEDRGQVDQHGGALEQRLEIGREQVTDLADLLAPVAEGGDDRPAQDPVRRRDGETPGLRRGR